MKRIVILLAVLLSGCASFNLGTMCYIPHGQAGGCQVTPK